MVDESYMTIQEGALEPEVAMANIQDLRGISTTGKSVRVAKENIILPAAQTTEMAAAILAAQTAQVGAETAETNAEAAEAQTLLYRDAAYAAQSAIILGGIAHNASAPTPGKSGKYYFTTAGSCTWLTGGAASVLIGQEVLVVFTSPSTYAYTLLAMTTNYAIKADNDSDHLRLNKKDWIIKGTGFNWLVANGNTSQKSILDFFQDVWWTDVVDTAGNFYNSNWICLCNYFAVNTNVLADVTTVYTVLVWVNTANPSELYANFVNFTTVYGKTQYVKKLLVNTNTGTATLNVLIDLTKLDLTTTTFTGGKYVLATASLSSANDRWLQLGKRTSSVYTESFIDRFALIAQDIEKLQYRDWLDISCYPVANTLNTSKKSIIKMIYDIWFENTNDDAFFALSTWNIGIGAVGINATTYALATHFYINIYFINGSTVYYGYLSAAIDKNKSVQLATATMATSATTSVAFKVIIDVSKIDMTTYTNVSSVYYIHNVGLVDSLADFKVNKRLSSPFDTTQMLKTSISVLSPDKVYSTCNDLTALTEADTSESINVYVERVILPTTKKYAKFRGSNTLYKSHAARKVYNEFTEETVNNYGEDVHTESVVDTIIGDEINDIPISYSHISTKASVADGKSINVLNVGDSTIWGYNSGLNKVDANNPNQSWMWAKYFFEKDNLLSGTPRIVDMTGHIINDSIPSTFVLNGITHVGYGEGHSGWTTENFLKTKDFTTNVNPFYDAAKSWTDTALNTAGVKFSIAKYLLRYRTMDDSRNRLYYDNTGATTGVGGSLGYIKTGESYNISDQYIGTEVTDTEAFNAYTPNVINIQLGFNDTTELAVWSENMDFMIRAIKEEFPSMIIVYTMIDAAGSYYPELWSGWDANQKEISFFEAYDNVNYWGVQASLHDRITARFNAAKAIEIQADDIYFLASNLVQPSAMSVPHTTINESGIGIVSYRPLPSYPYHPNNYAHACWGYHFYSFLNYLCGIGKL